MCLSRCNPRAILGGQLCGATNVVLPVYGDGHAFFEAAKFDIRLFQWLCNAMFFHEIFCKRNRLRKVEGKYDN